MLKRPRIIPTLLIQDQNLVKTKCFRDSRYLGDPLNAVRIFNEESVDELCIIDIGASKERTAPDIEYLSEIATEAFMPMSYGGGVQTLDQMREIFRAGYEKIILNTSAYDNPALVTEAVKEFGSQSIVIGIDYKKRPLRGNRVVTNGGLNICNDTPIDRALVAEAMGAGEILLYSIDCDGQMGGYDFATVKDVSNAVSVPVIACGGAGSLDDIKDMFTKTNVGALAAGSIFVFFGKKNAVLINYPDENVLIEKGIYYEE